MEGLKQATLVTSCSFVLLLLKNSLLQMHTKFPAIYLFFGLLLFLLFFFCLLNEQKQSKILHVAGQDVGKEAELFVHG